MKLKKISKNSPLTLFLFKMFLQTKKAAVYLEKFNSRKGTNSSQSSIFPQTPGGSSKLKEINLAYEEPHKVKLYEIGRDIGKGAMSIVKEGINVLN